MFSFEFHTITLFGRANISWYCPYCRVTCTINRIASGVNYFIAYAEQITNSVQSDETVFISSVITSEKAGQTHVRLTEEKTESNPL